MASFWKLCPWNRGMNFDFIYYTLFLLKRFFLLTFSILHIFCKASLFLKYITQNYHCRNWNSNLSFGTRISKTGHSKFLNASVFSTAESSAQLPYSVQPHTLTNGSFRAFERTLTVWRADLRQGGCHNTRHSPFLVVGAYLRPLPHFLTPRWWPRARAAHYVRKWPKMFKKSL